MSRRVDPVLPRLVESYFREDLDRVRGASHHTVVAYRDTLRLFFTFVAGTRRCDVSALRVDHLDVQIVTAFLTHLEATRRNSPATRNCRLAAIRSFVRHLARNDPPRAGQYHRILSLPAKKTPTRMATYLEPEEVRHVLDRPDRRTALGRRDHALLLLLYNTGARVSEALDVRVHDVERARPPHLRVRGKGRRERLCPLWSETMRALDALPTMQSGQPDQPLFLNRRAERLTRDGVAHMLRKYVCQAVQNMPTLQRRRVTPHVLRHSCAVALLQAGIDVSVIRDYLGHASVATTSRYITTNLQMKRDVLEAFWHRAGLTSTRTTPWRPTSNVLSFLASL
jgi:site-specific recombinase XerD